MGRPLHSQEQNTHHVLHLDIEDDDFLFIVPTLLFERVDSLESDDNDYFPVTMHVFSSYRRRTADERMQGFHFIQGFHENRNTIEKAVYSLLYDLAKFTLPNGGCRSCD